MELWVPKERKSTINIVFFMKDDTMKKFVFIYFNPLKAIVALNRNQLIDLHSKSIDWFLYEGNTGT